MFCVLVCLLCGFYPIVAADKPSQPTSVVFTYSPAFGGPLTVRAAWGEPKRWNDTGSSGDRYYIVHCEVGNTGQLVYNQTVSAQQFLVQFDVPNPRTNYLVRVYAVNRNGLLGQPGKASLRIP